MRIELDIPISEATLDQGCKDRLHRDALEAAVLRLFAERHISAADAATDLGLTRVEFLQLTQQRGIPYIDYTATDLAADLADLKELERRFPSAPPKS